LKDAQLLYFSHNLDVNMDELFAEVCSKGHLEVAKWFLQINPNINTSFNDENAYKSSIYNSQKHITD